MRDFIISTESNNDLPASFIQENQILVIPHYYNVEETFYGEPGKELSIKAFYDEMRAGRKVGTAASNPAVILEKFTEVARSGKDILHISFSSGLSGGYQNVVNGANEVMEEYPDCKIIVLDTLSASLGEGLMIQKAVDLRKEGADIEATAEAVRELIPHISIQFTVDDLQYLYRGGRVSKTSMVLGSMINIKPVLHVDDAGKLIPLMKVRGRKKSLSAMVDNMEAKIGSWRDKQMWIGIIHGDCEAEALQLKEQIEARFGFKNFMIVPIGPSIGAHSGPGTMGLVFLGEAR